MWFGSLVHLLALTPPAHEEEETSGKMTEYIVFKGAELLNCVSVGLLDCTRWCLGHKLFFLLIFFSGEC